MKTLKASDLLALGRGAATYKVQYSDLNQLVAVGVKPPSAPVKGALWLNDTNGVLYAYNGSVWVGK